jgi:radical SAM superfamily enzyme YgiQ (UPF0313 family)
MFPEIKIVIGGLGTDNEALAMMNNYEYYDYAVWGEGEYTLLRLCEKLPNKEIPRLIYRDKSGAPKISRSMKKEYFDLNSGIFPDYSDFFAQRSKNHNIHSLPVERSRGCNWNKCRFCSLNDGYRFRTKTNETMISELKHQIEKYHFRMYSCVDSDIVGTNINNFERFLDKLIKIKSKYSDFSILSAEVITKSINSAIIKKMSLGGINHVQIGYESPSNRLLQKINKKNTFASNLLFIKWAKEYSISVTGLNVLQGLLEETPDDIFEATDNLYFLRFLLSAKFFKHNMTRMTITKSSPYYGDIEKSNNLCSWFLNPYPQLLPDDYYDLADKYCLFSFSNNQFDALQWKFFYKVEEHFIKSNYEYQFIDNSDVIHYREYLNKTLLNEVSFEESLHWEVLKSCNHHVVSLKELCVLFPSSRQNDIVSAIEVLKSEGLLYHNDDFSEIVTPVNTDIIL